MSDSNEVADFITIESLQKAWEQIVNAPIPPPCGSRERPHVVHPRVHENGGWTSCGNCFMPLHIKNGQIDTGEQT